MKPIFLSIFLFLSIQLFAQAPIDKVVKIKVSTNTSPLTIKLTWNKEANASNYSIYRKKRDELSWTFLTTTSANTDTVYNDNNISQGIHYEYQILGGSGTTQLSGYVSASVNFPAQHLNGRLIVLIDSAYINYCAPEINQYILDIIKDGWRVTKKYIGRNTTVQNVKQQIKTLYLQDVANTKGVFLVGHIPVPYSGLINPDGHPDHFGAWPCDWYYADTSNTYWTDVNANDTTASRIQNRNIPGDGKFDQSTLNAGIIKYFVARVDVFDMPTIDANDSLLMKKYLQKDHVYRTMQKTFRQRMLIDDNFGFFGGEAFAQNGYRNGINLLGKDSVMDADYFTSMNATANSYLWSYGCGGGWYQGAGGVGSTTNFQIDSIQSVFTMLFGSYFGDWDVSNSFLRAPLASPSSTLTSCWAGRPNWNFHTMGIGEAIGLSMYTNFTMPSLYSPINYGSTFIHKTFLGDPTLRMYLFASAKNLALTPQANGGVVKLNWVASTDNAVIGYYIYRAKSLTDTFKLLNTNYTSALTFNDSTAPLGNNVFMVRAVKMQNTNSGTYYNLSSGIIDSIQVQYATTYTMLNAENEILVYPNPAIHSIRMECTNAQSVINKVEIVDLFGKKMKVEKIKMNEYAINNLPKGNYIVIVTMDSNKTFSKHITVLK